MADLDDFFAKKDKKKKTKKGFSKANTDILAKNLEENERKEQRAEEKANDASRATRIENDGGGLSTDNVSVSSILIPKSRFPMIDWDFRTMPTSGWSTTTTSVTTAT